MNGASGAGTGSRKFGSSAGMPTWPSWGAGDTAGTGASAVTPRSLAAQRGQCSGGWSVAGLVATRALQNGQLMNMAPIQAWAHGFGRWGPPELHRLHGVAIRWRAVTTARQNGRATVRTTVTHAQPVCRLPP